MVGIVRVEAPRHPLRGDVESLVTDRLFEGLEVRHLGAPGTDERIDFGPDSGYERCAPAASTIRLAVASARRRTDCRSVSKSFAFTFRRLSCPPGRAGPAHG